MKKEEIQISTPLDCNGSSNLLASDQHLGSPNSILVCPSSKGPYRCTHGNTKTGCEKAVNAAIGKHSTRGYSDRQHCESRSSSNCDGEADSLLIADLSPASSEVIKRFGNHYF